MVLNLRDNIDARPLAVIAGGETWCHLLFQVELSWHEVTPINYSAEFEYSKDGKEKY